MGLTRVYVITVRLSNCKPACCSTVRPAVGHVCIATAGAYANSSQRPLCLNAPFINHLAQVYMAPELIENRQSRRPYNPVEVDVWAAGVWLVAL